MSAAMLKVVVTCGYQDVAELESNDVGAQVLLLISDALRGSAGLIDPLRKRHEHEVAELHRVADDLRKQLAKMKADLSALSTLGVAK